MNIQSVQCETLARRGRCKRMTKDPSKKCHQHKHINVNVHVEQVTNEQVQNVNNARVSIRCEATTRNGEQCKKMTKNENKRCHLHNVEQATTSATVLVTSSEVASINRVETISMRSQRESSLDLNEEQHVENQPEQEVEIVLGDVEESESTSGTKSKKKKQKKEKVDDKEKNCKEHEECCICYEPVPSSDFLECSHAVCKECVKQLRDPRCPMCRTEIKSKNISEKEKRRMARRRTQDSRDRANELFRNYLQAQNQVTNNPVTSVFSVILIE